LDDHLKGTLLERCVQADGQEDAACLIDYMKVPASPLLIGAVSFFPQRLDCPLGEVLESVDVRSFDPGRIQDRFKAVHELEVTAHGQPPESARASAACSQPLTNTPMLQMFLSRQWLL
jgi:hypothetical protein